MFPDNVITLLWMLVFFIIFYLYIDIRLTKLRKELLSHYALCEKMLKDGGATGPVASPPIFRMLQEKQEPIQLINPSVPSFAPPPPLPQQRNHFLTTGSSDFSEIVPSKEETAMGLNMMNNMSLNGLGSINNILRTEESGGSNEWKITQGSSPDGVMAFNVHGMSDELAP